MVLPGGEENKADCFPGQKGGDKVSSRGIDMDADRLTDEAAEVIAGGVGGYAAECVAVDGGDAVVESRKAAQTRGRTGANAEKRGRGGRGAEKGRSPKGLCLWGI